MKPLTLRALSVFETAASLGSFSKAADHLDMTQPAVSMQVRQIEAALGVALFDSHSRRHLTDAGRELLQHARLILAQVRAAEEAVTAYGPAGAGDAQGSGLRGMLHLGVVSSAHYFAPQLMQAFNSLHPLVRLKLTVARRDEVLAMLRDHALDIAISGYPLRRPTWKPSPSPATRTVWSSIPATGSSGGRSCRGPSCATSPSSFASPAAPRGSSWNTCCRASRCSLAAASRWPATRR
jgi:DNA-binding transcriptional LysR family regulator